MAPTIALSFIGGAVVAVLAVLLVVAVCTGLASLVLLGANWLRWQRRRSPVPGGVSAHDDATLTSDSL